MGNRRNYKSARNGAPMPGRKGAYDAMPLSLLRRFYIAAQRSGYGRRYLTALRDDARQNAGDPAIVKRMLIDAFGTEPFPFDDVDTEWYPRVQALRYAFDEPAYPYPGWVDGDERVSPERWMIDMPILSPSTCRYVLPRVMVDLLSFYEGEFRCTDLVVQYLDVEGDHRPENLKDVLPLVERLIGKGSGVHWVQEYNDEAEHRREGKVAHFCRFTREQREAILAWLLLARSWPECSILQDNLSSAIDYWHKQCVAN